MNTALQNTNNSTNILEVLEKILDKGVVIAGDIRISLAQVELISIKLRLIVASVDKAKEIGLDWWENDSYLSSKAKELEENHSDLVTRMDRIEKLLLKEEKN